MAKQPDRMPMTATAQPMKGKANRSPMKATTKPMKATAKGSPMKATTKPMKAKANGSPMKAAAPKPMKAKLPVYQTAEPEEVIVWKEWNFGYETKDFRYELVGIWLDFRKKALGEKWAIYAK